MKNVDWNSPNSLQSHPPSVPKIGFLNQGRAVKNRFRATNPSVPLPILSTPRSAASIPPFCLRPAILFAISSGLPSPIVVSSPIVAPSCSSLIAGRRKIHKKVAELPDHKFGEFSIFLTILSLPTLSAS
jgi:hypothetical protein